MASVDLRSVQSLMHRVYNPAQDTPPRGMLWVVSEPNTAGYPTWEFAPEQPKTPPQLRDIGLADIAHFFPPPKTDEREIEWDRMDMGPLLPGRILRHTETGVDACIVHLNPVTRELRVKHGDVYETWQIADAAAFRYTKFVQFSLIEKVETPKPPPCRCYSNWEHENVPGCQGVRP